MNDVTQGCKLRYVRANLAAPRVAWRRSVVPWPASKKITKRMIKHSFLLAENREYHQVYQASVLQFRFESAWGW